jgi:hypothetical protein
MNSNNFVSPKNQNLETNLSPENLRIYKGFENLTDEEAEKNIELIKVFADVLYRLYCNKNHQLNSGKR